MKRTAFLFLCIFVTCILTLTRGIAAKGEDLQVKNLRLGHHGNFTRITLECAPQLQIIRKKKSTSSQIILELRGAGKTVLKQVFKPDPETIKILKGISSFKSDNKIFLKFELQQNTGLKQFFIMPAGKNKGSLLVLDLEDRPSPSPVSRPECMRHTQKVYTGDNNNDNSLRPKKIIIIDPGHGGNDPGTISLHGHYEKNITLSFAREIQKKLNATGKYHAVLTRTNDKAVPLRDRFALARDLDAQLFISVHADSNPKKTLKGFSVYTLSSVASDLEAQKLAIEENRAEILNSLDLTENCPETSNILIDLSQRDTLNKSIFFAGCLVQKAVGFYRLPTKSHRFADFAVLKAPDIPSVLIELGYLSNREDEARLTDQKYKGRFAQIMVKAINSYFESIHLNKG